MISDDFSDGLADPRHEPGVLELPDGRVILGIDCRELVVAIELDLPAKLSKLLWQSGFDKVDGTVVHPELCLDVVAFSGGIGRRLTATHTWPPLSSDQTRIRSVVCVVQLPAHLNGQPTI